MLQCLHVSIYNRYDCRDRRDRTRQNLKMKVKVMCRIFEQRKDIHNKIQTGTSGEKCNSKAFRLGIKPTSSGLLDQCSTTELQKPFPITWARVQYIYINEMVKPIKYINNNGNECKCQILLLIYPYIFYLSLAIVATQQPGSLRSLSARFHRYISYFLAIVAIVYSDRSDRSDYMDTRLY